MHKFLQLEFQEPLMLNRQTAREMLSVTPDNVILSVLNQSSCVKYLQHVTAVSVPHRDIRAPLQGVENVF